MSNKTDGFVNTCAAAEMGEISPFSGSILSRKIRLPFCEHWAATRPVRMEAGEIANLSRLGLSLKFQVNRNIAAPLQFFR